MEDFIGLKDNLDTLSKEMNVLKHIKDKLARRGERSMDKWLQDVEGIVREVDEIQELQRDFLPNIDARQKLNAKVIETLKVVKALKEDADGSSKSVERSLGELEQQKIQRYSHPQLEIITERFSVQIGSGAYGDVFKGQLSNNVKVAVKVLKTSRKDIVEHTFMAEVSTMSSTLHRNLVKLYGYCFEANMKALVYEYLERGSLDKVLYENRFDIKWEKLYDIATETAMALSYLHENCHKVIVHYDVKPANVLLDSNLSPKVADFGLAKVCNRDDSHISMFGFRGTKGFAAPEMFMNMPVHLKCDVYSFGMMLFEILGRRRIWEGENWIPGQVWDKFKNGKLNEIIVYYGIEDKNKEKAKILATVALWCTQHKPGNRPSMGIVVQVLKGNIQLEPPPDPLYPYGDSSSTSNWGPFPTTVDGPPPSPVSSVVSTTPMKRPYKTKVPVMRKKFKPTRKSTPVDPKRNGFEIDSSPLGPPLQPTPVDVKGSRNSSDSCMSTEEVKEHILKVPESTNSTVDMKGSSNNSDSLINRNNSDSGVSSEKLKEHFTDISLSTNSTSSREIPSLENELKEKSKADTNLSRRREAESLLETFQKLCPPGGENLVIIYTSSLGGIRKTNEACRDVRLILQFYQIEMYERDLWIQPEYKEELRKMLGRIEVPVLFVKGRFIGGAEKVKEMNEDGELSILLDGIPNATAKI